jgi:HEPN domain-containing protein
MSKTKTYLFSDFAQTKDEAVRHFFHAAYDHMTASRYLFTKTLLIDSAAYLCNIAFELLLKGMHLSENGRYKRIHRLIPLYESLNKAWFAKRDISLLKIIDRCSLIRYPIDSALLNSSKALRRGKLTYGVGEIGTDDLEAAGKLFLKIWRKLEKNAQFKYILQDIKNNPYKKGSRILMRKRRGAI